MRRDWDARAAVDADGYVYTRDRAADLAGFEASGRANYDQLVRPYLPVLLGGRPARACRALEIGCGSGRMTRCFAEDFAEVHAVDVSPAMLARARERLAGVENAALHLGSGYDLADFADASFDFVFSYIVFQHIPVRAVIEGYVREAARVLRPGGAFKFQVNGDQSPAYREHPRDTWLGETFSFGEACAMLDAAGLALVMAEGASTQYFVLTARRGPVDEAVPRGYILPGEPWAAGQLLEGWHAPVDGSWRPVDPASLALVRSPAANGGRFFLALYFWPEEPVPEHVIAVTIGGRAAGRTAVHGPGDHYIELAAPLTAEPAVEVRIEIAPPCAPRFRPAVRCLGLYLPA